jgi:hypothetical protein
MSEPAIIEVRIADGPAVIQVNTDNQPAVIAVHIPGLQGPPGTDGEDGEGGSGTNNVREADGTITVDADDDDWIYVGAGVATINLPPSAGRTQGRSIMIVDDALDADSNTKTITPDGSETIRGLSSYTITFRGGTVELMPRADNAGWNAREG